MNDPQIGGRHCPAPTATRRAGGSRAFAGAHALPDYLAKMVSTPVAGIAVLTVWPATMMTSLNARA